MLPALLLVGCFVAELPFYCCIAALLRRGGRGGTDSYHAPNFRSASAAGKKGSKAPAQEHNGVEAKHHAADV